MGVARTEPARGGAWLLLGIAAAVLATGSATLGWLDLHRATKPLAMVFAIVFVALRARPSRAGRAFGLWLMAALACSLAGDVLLMFPGYFVPGLVAFLLAHLVYIGLFKRGMPWFPSRGALAATLGVGAVMYGVLWFGGLPVALRAPVAAYVLAIALMAAQAIGRARRLGGPQAWMVAGGACAFILSDALLALNRFVQPLPLAQLWVLSSYYVAQFLIACGACPESAKAESNAELKGDSAAPASRTSRA